MTFKHPLNFRVGTADISMSFDEHTTTILIPLGELLTYKVDGAPVALGVDYSTEEEKITLCVLTHVGDNEYQGTVIELGDEVAKNGYRFSMSNVEDNLPLSIYMNHITSCFHVDKLVPKGPNQRVAVIPKDDSVTGYDVARSYGFTGSREDWEKQQRKN